MRNQGEQSERNIKKAEVPLGKASGRVVNDQQKIFYILVLDFHDKPSDMVVSVQPSVGHKNTDVPQYVHVYTQQVVW